MDRSADLRARVYAALKRGGLKLAVTSRGERGGPHRVYRRGYTLFLVVDRLVLHYEFETSLMRSQRGPEGLSATYRKLEDEAIAVLVSAGFSAYRDPGGSVRVDTHAPSPSAT